MTSHDQYALRYEAGDWTPPEDRPTPPTLAEILKQMSDAREPIATASPLETAKRSLSGRTETTTE